MKTSPSRFSLVCLNLRFGLAEDGDNGWRRRKRAYPSLFDSHPADFFLFQEANDFQIEFLSALLPGHDMIGQRKPAPDRWQSNVIFYHRKWRRTHMRHFYLSATPDVPSKFSQSQWPRQCTMGTFQRGDRTVTLANTHFDFESGVQCRSAELINSMIDGLAASWPVVLAGDFNADTTSPCYALLTERPQGLRDAFDGFCPGTYHGFSGSAEGGAIDWVLYRGAMRVVSAQVIRERFSGHYPSDHFPLLVQFEQAP